MAKIKNEENKKNILNNCFLTMSMLNLDYSYIENYQTPRVIKKNSFGLFEREEIQRLQNNLKEYTCEKGTSKIDTLISVYFYQEKTGESFQFMILNYK